MRLYFIHFFAWLAIWMATYLPGLDVLLSIIYLVIIVQEIIPLRKYSLIKRWSALIIWQSPGLLLSFVSITPWSWLGFREYGFFILEFWYTPILPLLSLSRLMVGEYPLYYYLLLMMPVIFGVLFWTVIKKPALRSS